MCTGSSHSGQGNAAKAAIPNVFDDLESIFQRDRRHGGGRGMPVVVVEVVVVVVVVIKSHGHVVFLPADNSNMQGRRNGVL